MAAILNSLPRSQINFASFSSRSMNGYFERKPKIFLFFISFFFWWKRDWMGFLFVSEISEVDKGETETARCARTQKTKRRWLKKASVYVRSTSIFYSDLTLSTNMKRKHDGRRGRKKVHFIHLLFRSDKKCLRAVINFTPSQVPTCLEKCAFRSSLTQGRWS